MEDKKAILMFCANDQRETEHTLDIDGNAEVVLTCVECGRFQKLPAGTTAEDIKVFVEKHKASNEGQITTASIEAEKAQLLEGLETVDVQVPTEEVKPEESV